MKKLKYGVFALSLLISVSAFSGAGHAPKGKTHDEEKLSQPTKDKKEHDEAGIVEIDAMAQHEAEIKTTILKLQTIPKYLHAPGEVIPNTNQSSKITPRIAAQVMKRKVNIGDYVEKNQALVILSSVEMARAQSDLLLAYHEWQRVKGLGKQAIGAKRYQTAQINYRHASAKLIAYGMNQTQVDNFVKGENSAEATGKFTLLATQSGTIYDAKVIEGERVEPGHVLYHILDESSLWVDARLFNSNVQLVKKGATALIGKPKHWTQGKVIQIHHKLEETTRTQIVRIEIPNIKDTFHPGQFVNCRIAIGDGKPVLVVPESAVLRTADGDWAIYVEVKPNHFKQIEVKLIETINKQAIIEGVKPGIRVVTENAFAVHSELLKSGFQTHNH
jgi:cobalt-zinc-cadmium efflux system membrane fusion protein